MIFSLFYLTQRSTLGWLTLDVLLREQIDFPSEVTQYPVEDGGPDISDHITQGNEKLEISGSVSASAVEAWEFSDCYSKLMDAVEMLREMHMERQPITVVTGIGIYEEMGFTGLTVTRNAGNDKGGSWLDIDATLIKVIKVELEEGELPPDQVSEADPPGAKGKAGATETKGGSSGTSAKEPADGNKTAALRAAESLGVAPAARP